MSEVVARTDDRASPTSRSTALGWLLVVVSAAAMAAVSRHLEGTWWLLPVALVPMVVAQYRLLTPRQGAVGVGVVAFGYWAGVAAMGEGFLPRIVYLAVAVPIAVAVGLLALLDRPYAERTGYRWFLVQMPVLWVGLDVLLSLNPFLASESWLAYDLAGVPALIQPVSIVGTPTLSFVVLVANYAVALLVLTLIDRRGPRPGTVPVPRRTGVIGIAVGASLVAVWVVGSIVLLQQTPDSFGEPVTVAAVQPGVSAGGAVAPYAPLVGDSEMRRRLEAGTAEATRAGASLVVWPELVIGGDPSRSSGTWVSDVARSADAWLVVGVSGEHGEDPPNTAVVLRPDGEPAGVYGKQHPVVLENEHFSQPIGQQVYTTPWGRFGVTICYDNQYVDTPRRAASLGAQLIATPVLVWSTMGPGQNDEIVFRAVENRVAYVRADWAWSSVVVAPDGTVVANAGQVAEPRRATVIAAVPLGTGNSPFTRFGWLVPWLFVAGLVLRMVDQWRTSPRRSRRRAPADDTAATLPA